MAEAAQGTLSRATDSAGLATFRLPAGEAGGWVIAEKPGYFQSKDVLSVAGRGAESISLRLRREPQLRVRNSWGRDIEGYTLSTQYGGPVPDTRGVGTLVRNNVIVSAPGYLSVALQAAPLGVISPYREETEKVVYLLEDADLPELAVRVTGAPAGTIAFARVVTENTNARPPYVAPTASSAQLERLPTRWRRFYETGGGGAAGDQVILLNRRRDPAGARLRVGETLSIYARGDITIRCWIEDHTPMVGRAAITGAARQELVLACSPAPWPLRTIQLVDRYGRRPRGAVTTWIMSPFRRALDVHTLGLHRVKLPPDAPELQIAFHAPGLGSTELTPDQVGAAGAIRVAFDAVALVLRFVDARTGAEFRGKDIEAKVGTAAGRYLGAEGFDFGLVRPKVREVRIRLHGGPRRWQSVPLDIAEQAAYSPHVRKTLRVAFR